MDTTSKSQRSSGGLIFVALMVFGLIAAFFWYVIKNNNGSTVTIPLPRKEAVSNILVEENSSEPSAVEGQECLENKPHFSFRSDGIIDSRDIQPYYNLPPLLAGDSWVCTPVIPYKNFLVLDNGKMSGLRWLGEFYAIQAGYKNVEDVIQFFMGALDPNNPANVQQVLTTEEQVVPDLIWIRLPGTNRIGNESTSEESASLEVESNSDPMAGSGQIAAAPVEEPSEEEAPKPPSTEVVYLDPPATQANQEGLQLMGPQPPTPTPDFGLDLPKEQGPGIDNTDPETLSVEELVNRSWIDELHIVDRVDDQNQCDNLKLSRVILAPAGDNLLGITYKVDFSAWAEHYVGPCPKVMLVDSDRHVNHPSITRGENKIVGFSDNISAYEPEIVDEAPPDKDDERPRTDYEDITITDFAHRGSAEIVAEQTCRGETPDYNNFIMENDSGTYRILGVNIYHASYTGPCEMIKIVSEGVKPGMHIWGVSGYVLTGYKDAFAPIGPPAP